LEGALIHTVILLACLLVGWGLAAAVMRVAPGLARWGDRRACHQLALASPLLSLGLAGGWSAQMAVSGCLMFSTWDGIGTLVLTSAVAASLLVAAVRETWRIKATHRRLAAIATHAAGEAIETRVAELAESLGVKRPQVRVFDAAQPIACVAGTARPVLYLSSGLLVHLDADEADAILAHELAHLRHQDNLLAWLDAVLLRAFQIFAPLRRAWREGLVEREEAADALAALTTRRPLVLAGALIKVAEWGPSSAASGSAAFLDDMGALERRVERLLAFEVTDRPWGGPAVAAAAVGAALPFVTAGALGYATSCIVHV
jgi:Zn-dependent protease with chaperone function